MSSKRKYIAFIGLGFELAGLVVSLVLLGMWADKNLGFMGLGVASGAILSIVIWVAHLVYTVRVMQKNEAETKNEPAER